MTRLKIEQEDEVFAVDQDDEHLDVTMSVFVPTNPRGAITGPSSGMGATATRVIPEHTADPTFLRIAFASRGWTLLAGEEHAHAKSTIVFDRRRNNAVQDVITYELGRVKVLSWSLEWQGEGDDDLQGGVFHESIELEGIRGSVTCNATNGQEGFEFTRSNPKES